MPEPNSPTTPTATTDSGIPTASGVPTDSEVPTIFGIPASLEALRSREARSRWFEPENPRIFVPRSFGIGWDINMGALAVRLGMIRPDDSLPDLEDYIPPRTRRALSIAPALGGALTAGAAALVARRHRLLPSGFRANLRPRSIVPAVQAVAPAALLGAGGTTLAAWGNRERVDVPATALAAGLQATALLSLVAQDRYASHRPASAALLAGCTAVALPAVAAGVVVATTRGALRNLDRLLKRKHSENPAASAGAAEAARGTTTSPDTKETE
ncbi:MULTISPECIES: DUF5808 domain-containing protein [Actinotignum]|uniref:DUF5808 domain-containing protein n=1 Tax=Actinotignum TaxID=1653174 RepID=UPI00254FCD30|nr:DUF5808 domain-containing protein [Actinotignum schaalii]MDE1536323.1 DUF5808 domain-containing protein [Actinotignum schaalii]MDK7272482.1 DUF5808 domain-containing protein [Actinotignum schaalii]